MLALSHDPNFKTLGFINTLLTLAMSKHQRFWKIIIISHLMPLLLKCGSQ
jgi:hypothetical protein